MTVIGTLIGDRFRLEEKVGSGGMSSVYRAFDPTLERQVAIKLMHRDISSDPDQLERFRREARAVAQLNHPHVVTVIDAGEDDGAPVHRLRVRRGRDAQGAHPPRWAACRSPRRSPTRSRSGGRSSARTRHLLVHRDVKPQNVLIDADGRAKVTDFGIARSLEAQGLTATGRVLGTTDYVSPEQALGHDVTAQSDIYSLGDRALRDAHRRGAVQGRHAGGGGDEARAASRCPTCSGAGPRSRRRWRPWSSARPPRRRATATPPSTRWCTTSRRCSPSRPRAPARRPARRRPCCARCPTTPADFAPQRLRHPRRTLFMSIAVLAIVAGTVAFFATRTEKGPGAAATPAHARPVRP